MLNYIYVKDKSGKPCAPSTRQSHFRRLIRSGMAKVISVHPYTVQLLYNVEDTDYGFTLGIDTGRENIGVSVSSLNGSCLYKAELDTCNKSIKVKMDERRRHRGERRHNRRQKKQRKAIKNDSQIQNGDNAILQNRKACKSIKTSYPGMDEVIEQKAIRGKEAKYNNRKRKPGWLTPSGRQLIQMHMSCIKLVSKLIPISKIVMETVKFDFQKLEDEDIDDWQHGPLFGYKNYKEYIYDIQEGKCLLCKKNNIDQYHHIVPRGKRGSNTPKNIAGLCDSCHNNVNGVHKSEDAIAELKSIKAGSQQEYTISLLNSIMPQLVDTVTDYCNKHNIQFVLTNGGSTYVTRNIYNISKTHANDAYAISLYDSKNINELAINVDEVPDAKLKRFKKKSNNNIHSVGSRKYYVNGEVVAVNRHKAEGQTRDSLEEYLASGKSINDITVCPAKRTYTCHQEGIVVDMHPGDIIRYVKYNKTYKNTKTSTFVAESVKPSKNKIAHNGSKEKTIDFCHRIKSGAIQYV